jgi:hypothetical protein
MSHTVGEIAGHSKSPSLQSLSPPLPSGADACDWLRLPRPKSRLWGLSRTTWNELLDSGEVKGVTLRKRHAQRGIKLIYRPSAEAYLKGLMDEKDHT